jgi:hypothetical protein
MRALVQSQQDTLHFLGQVLFTDPDSMVCLEAVDLIAAEQSPANQALLNIAVKDSDEKVRDAAKRYLMKYR